MQVTPTALRALNTSFQALFSNAFDGVTPTWSKVAMEVPSTTKTNTYGWMKKMPGMREWLGDRVINNVSAASFAIANKAYEATLGIDRDDIEDDNLGIYNPMLQEMGIRAAEHPDELVWGLLPAGFTAQCYDGQFFFDTDHPVVDANGAVQSVSNFQGGAGTPWYIVDDTRALKPLIYQNRKPTSFVSMTAPDDPNVFHKKEFLYGAEARRNVGFGLWQLAYASRQTLDMDNLFAAIAAHEALRGDGGQLLGIRPSLLVVPPSLRKVAKQLLEADIIAQANAGVSNVSKGLLSLHVETRLG
jgi:phage major head subunit gpT-like protein